MIFIWDSVQELVDDISAVSAETAYNRYPTEFRTYDEAWDGLFQTVSKLKDKIGKSTNEVAEMLHVAQQHFVSGEIKLGSWLLQDVQQILTRESPFAYPEELYRWKR